LVLSLKVLICLLHVSITALKRGKHVLCEKPMATNLKDAEAMVEAAKEAKKR